ncbi:dihydrofolate reductase family protein [Gordonia sp. PP30]|uniref:dihydrofolate reductase family protein n=1 Tax=Gordonia sp. PP30 TaxID=2935861 RepID=UPI001FFF209E|nr:dihydrofolate reductase family protein [Gordonia sp. PP30]UQE73268.1 dihydrofolate reductase family protein [Gordonia sp. PP30]
MIPAELQDEYRWPAGPWLRTNFVYSIDGSLTRDQHSAGLSGPADNALLHHLRATADAVVVGASTATAEDYIGISLPDDEALARERRGQGGPPALVVVTASGRIGSPHRFITQTITGNFLLLTSTDHDAVDRAVAAIDASNGTMELLHAPDGLAEGLSLLHNRGYSHLLCEGGPTLTDALLRDDLVDELCITLSPNIGGEGRPRPTAAVTADFVPTVTGIVDHFLFTRWTRTDKEPR